MGARISEAESGLAGNLGGLRTRTQQRMRPHARSHSPPLMLIAFSGWVNRHQAGIIDYLVE